MEYRQLSNLSSEEKQQKIKELEVLYKTQEEEEYMLKTSNWSLPTQSIMSAHLRRCKDLLNLQWYFITGEDREPEQIPTIIIQHEISKDDGCDGKCLVS